MSFSRNVGEIEFEFEDINDNKGTPEHRLILTEQNIKYIVENNFSKNYRLGPQTLDIAIYKGNTDIFPKHCICGLNFQKLTGKRLFDPEFRLTRY